jgi:hypothetical protein
MSSSLLGRRLKDNGLNLIRPRLILTAQVIAYARDKPSSPSASGL